MVRLIYASNMSLDGCTEDERGAFDWAPPDDDVFASITELMRSAGTYLYGRRMYETMAVWETNPTLAAQSDLMADFANVWHAADKVVYSSTLVMPSTANTRIERHFDPSAVHDLKAAATRDLLVGGPNLAVGGDVSLIHAVFGKHLRSPGRRRVAEERQETHSFRSRHRRPRRCCARFRHRASRLRRNRRRALRAPAGHGGPPSGR